MWTGAFLEYRFKYREARRLGESRGVREPPGRYDQTPIQGGIRPGKVSVGYKFQLRSKDVAKRGEMREAAGDSVVVPEIPSHVGMMRFD